MFPLITDPQIQTYCDAHSTRLPSVFDSIAKDTASTGKTKMLSGQFLGQFLKMMSMTLAPNNVLEVGTFTGYGTLCLLEGLQEGGHIYTIEKSEAHYELAKLGFEKSERKDVIKPLLGDAAELIEKMDVVFDLVFIDAAKRQYVKYYEMILPKLRKGGIILGDNVLWKGKVGHPENDKLGQGIDAFNKHVVADKRVENIILPIDDGVNFIIKK